MTRIKLKRLLGKNREATDLVKNLIDDLGSTIAVTDPDGHLLLGAPENNAAQNHRVVFENETLGWVSGTKGAASVASLLGHLAAKEAEKKALAGEVLHNYRELNLLYNLSEKMTVSIEFDTLGQLALSEAKRLIKATDGAVMLLNEKANVLEPISAFGKIYRGNIDLQSGETIIGRAVASGQPVMVNTTESEPIFLSSQNQFSSLVCAPLKARQRVIAIIIISSNQALNYTAADLKLLNTIASQTAPAIEHALFFQKKLHEARQREAKLKQQIIDLHIELDEVRRARKVAEITETEYFRRLQARATELRKKKGR